MGIESSVTGNAWFQRTPSPKGEAPDMRNDIVIIFLALVIVVSLGFGIRSAQSTVTEWCEETWEVVDQKRLAARLLKKMENEPREGLLDMALAVALSPYNWPNRRADDDEGLVRARERYLAVFTSLNDEGIKQWILERVQDTNSHFLKVVLESLKQVGRDGG